MEKERNRAKENGYSDPICNDKTSTDHQFNSAMSYALDHIEQISLFAGTHNE